MTDICDPIVLDDIEAAFAHAVYRARAGPAGADTPATLAAKARGARMTRPVTDPVVLEDINADLARTVYDAVRRADRQRAGLEPPPGPNREATHHPAPLTAAVERARLSSFGAEQVERVGQQAGPPFPCAREPRRSIPVWSRTRRLSDDFGMDSGRRPE